MSVIVFIGDSITDCDRLTDRRGLGYGYVDMVAAALDPSSTVVNAGVAGNRVAHLQQRWDADVIAHSPSLVSVAIGVNDTLVAFFEGRPTPVSLFETRYASLLERSAGSRLVLVEPFFVPSELPSIRWGEGYAFVQEDLAEKQAVVRSLATAHGAALVPTQSIVDTVVESRGPTMVAADGVHPTPLGHRLIADAWLHAHATLPAA